jgi:iron complex outermembrane receptor protein
VTPQVDMTFAASRWIESAFVPNDRAPAYAEVNANLTWHSLDHHLMVQLFMRNVGDKAVYTGGQQYPFVGNFVGKDIAPPRTFGATFRETF